MILRDSCPNPQQPQPQTQPTAIEIEYVSLFIIFLFQNRGPSCDTEVD